MGSSVTRSSLLAAASRIADPLSPALTLSHPWAVAFSWRLWRLGRGLSVRCSEAALGPIVIRVLQDVMFLFQWERSSRLTPGTRADYLDEHASVTT